MPSGVNALSAATKGVFLPIGSRFARANSKRAQQGTVLFHAFPSGMPQARPSFFGFRQHYAGAGVLGSPVNPPGLTRYPVMGENWALKLSTPNRPLAQIPTSQQGFGVYKNLSRFWTPGDAKLISFSGYFASMVGREAPGSNWSIGIDAQTWKNTDRSFFKMSCRYPGSSAAQWYAVDNSGASIAIPENLSKRHTAGLNQNKANMNYVEMTIKLEANGSGESTRGEYYALQINDMVFDFTNTAIWADPTQSGQETPQGAELDPSTSAAHLLNYDGGLNFGVFGSPPSTETSYPWSLICCDLMATVYDL